MVATGLLAFGAGLLVADLFDDDDYYGNMWHGPMPYYPPYPYRPHYGGGYYPYYGGRYYSRPSYGYGYYGGGSGIRFGFNYGGGGHHAAGTCQVPAEQAERVLGEIAAAVNQAAPAVLPG